MRQDKIIPTHSLYKTLDTDLHFAFWKLEETYDPYNFSLPHRHNYYEIFFFNKSGGTHEIDFQVYPIQKESLHFISPEQVHLMNRKQSVMGYVIQFTQEFYSLDANSKTTIDDFPLFNNPSSSPIVLIKNSQQRKTLMDLIGKIQSEYLASCDYKAEILRAYLIVFFITARRIYQPEHEQSKELSANTKLGRKFKALIEKNFLQIKSVSLYADLLHITAGHLNDSIHTTTGKTASDIIHERVILEAKRLLYYSDKNVKEIAYALNYNDPSYFTKFFKNHTSLTPEQFRRHIREKYH